MFDFIKRLFIKQKIGNTGAIESPVDNRDHIKVISKENLGPAGSSNLPESFTLADKIGPILNQKETNACTGFSGTYLMNVLINKTLGTNNNYNLNPYFNYYWARKYSGFSISEDRGAYVRDALKGLKNKGVWCCNMDSPTSNIPKDFKELTSFKLKGYERVEPNTDTLIDDLKYILAIEQLPLYCSVRVISENVNMKTGEFTPIKTASLFGLHAMTVVGYKIDKNNITWFHTANSWGKLEFGDNGFAWIHEDYFKNKNLVPEIWCPVKSYF